MNRTLTSPQALEVAKRLNPPAGTTLAFTAYGTVLHDPSEATLLAWQTRGVEVFRAARTSAGLTVTVVDARGQERPSQSPEAQ